MKVLLLLNLKALILLQIRDADSASCVNSVDYIYGDDANQTCDWIRRDEDRRQKLCLKTEVSSSCPISCGHCCEDDPEYAIKRKGDNKNCSWLDNKRKKQKWCDKFNNDKMVWKGCPKACNACFSKITNTPTHSPTSKPSCVDSLDYIYENDENHTCRWIRKREQRADLCLEAEVSSNCPISCGYCCNDDSNYRIKLKPGDNKKCKWLNSKRKKEKWCGKFNNGKLVKNGCPKACDACFSKITNTPSAMPSLSTDPTPKQTLPRTEDPTEEPTDPNDSPTTAPTDQPTTAPTDQPTTAPTDQPTTVPTDHPNPPTTLTNLPTTAPTDQPTIVPTDQPTTTPTDQPTTIPTDLPTTPPTDPNDSPTTAPTDQPTTPPTDPNDSPTTAPTDQPTSAPTDQPTTAPTDPPTTLSPRASWMSGKHGVGYRVPGGTHFATKNFNPLELVDQIKDLPITYFIFGLSSGAAGDRYLAPHPKFKELGMRAVTPKNVNTGYYTAENIDESQNVNLEDIEDIDVFDNFLTEMDKIGVKVIAYLNVEGPAKLKHGESSAFDYPGNTAGFNTGGYFVNNSAAVCQELDNVDQCSPSTRKWVKWVAQNYTIPYTFTDAYVDNSPLNEALKHAYANVVVDYYAKKYGNRIAGFWFDAGAYGNSDEIFAAVRRHNPGAAIAYNGSGFKIPLKNNNGHEEDFTSGHMTPLVGGTNPPDGCYNYGMVLSAESSHNGYVYESVSPYVNLGLTTTTPNPYIQPGFEIKYTPDSEPSLAHVYLPAQETWNSGDLIWNDTQAAEWVHRITSKKGAFTWAVRRSGCAGCDVTSSQATINPPDLEFLRRVYALLPANGMYQFNATNCDCLSELGTSEDLSWGCKYNPPEDDCKNDNDWRFLLNGSPKGCTWVCKGSHIRCKTEYTGDGYNAIEKCPYCCKDSCQT